MAAVVAHHALGPPRRAGRVKNIQRIGGRDGHRIMRRRRRLGLGEVMVAPRGQRGAFGLALQDQAGIRLVRRQRDRRVEQRLVFHHPPRLEPARGGDNHLRLGIGDARGKLGRREAAEHHGMDRAQPRAGQHRDRRLRHHRQVDHHPVAASDAQGGQGAGQLRRARLHLPVAEGLDPPGHRAVPDQRRLLAAPRQHMAIEAVEAGVQHAAGEPPTIRTQRGIEHAVPSSGPR